MSRETTDLMIQARQYPRENDPPKQRARHAQQNIRFPREV